MQFKTHLLIGLMVVLFFLPVVENKIVFILVTLFASALPDVDTGFSTFGQSKLARPLQLFVAHRGIIHSFTTCIALSIVLAHAKTLAPFIHKTFSVSNPKPELHPVIR